LFAIPENSQFGTIFWQFLLYCHVLRKYNISVHLSTNLYLMKKNKPKFYVVWKGRDTGVFYTWAECKAAIDKFEGALYKSYESEEEAFAALKKGFQKTPTQGQSPVAKPATKLIRTVVKYCSESLAVDAACSGNPGNMEYRGVYVKNGRVIFKMGPFPDGTNNIGEFLAIVHGLALLKKQNLSMPLYSDSMIAIGWVRRKHCNTKLEPTSRNQELFELISRAEQWLATNTYTTSIQKWETDKWGEIPADFGRK